MAGLRFLLFALAAFLFSCQAQPRSGKKLLYIMIDGFRYDYVDDQTEEQLPGFKELLRTGVRAQYMTPIFPSVSYPDWTTLVTGLTAESHGVVGNFMYDAQDKDSFALFQVEKTGKKKWWTAEPIWTTATKQGLKTAVILWSRCDVPFDGVTPDYCEPFVKIRGYEIFRTNMEKAIDKLEEGFDFVMLYNEHTDNVGHSKGPETEERRQAIRDLDSTIVYMLDRLDEMEMRDKVNVVVVSDHGMTTTAPQDVNYVKLDDYLLTDYVESITESGSHANIKVREGFVDQVYEKLKGMPGVDVYLHDQIPDDLHYKNNKYVHDILVKADIKTYILPSSSSAQIPPFDGKPPSLGAHGFDPREEKMRAIFFANGPDFQSGKVIPAIKNLDVYPLLAQLLGVTPRPNNGTMDTIKMALRSSPAPPGPTPNDAGSPAAPGLAFCLVWAALALLR